MIIKKLKPQNADESNIFWITMTDLMLGLVIVFMLLFVFAITGYGEKSEQVSHLKKKIKTLTKKERIYYSRKFSAEIKNC